MIETQNMTIVNGRVEIYRDFTINLIHYIFFYYLDKETLNSKNDIYNHYTFCFNKVCDEFKEENIDFSRNTTLKDYFYNYFYEHFYKSKTDYDISQYLKFWEHIFKICSQKNNNTFKILVDIYKIFDFSIKNN